MKKQPLNNRNDGKICYGSSILPNIILYAIEEIDGVMVYPSKKMISSVSVKKKSLLTVILK